MIRVILPYAPTEGSSSFKYLPIGGYALLEGDRITKRITLREYSRIENRPKSLHCYFKSKEDFTLKIGKKTSIEPRFLGAFQQGYYLKGDNDVC